ncbi:MAG: glycyl-radical enzyme activating protein [Bacteroides sp.]|nr:glycyl-radical enzyme activating protein [Bacteroides sp.]
MYIFDIKRFAINDGPGIRVTLFMKGCPLRCVWCHNPEGLESRQQKMYVKKKCIGCQTCVDVCPQHGLVLTPDGIKQTAECTHCGKCVEECPTLALEMAGKAYSMAELMKLVEKDRLVMETSGGGVTLCGGEPLMHPDYLVEILEELGRRNLHRTVDTTLYASEATIERVLPHTDLFMVDMKHMNSELHQKYTGVPNEPILRNIRLIAEKGARYWIRIPLIEGVNADEENIRQCIAFLKGLPTPPEMVNILPYHDIGIGKHKRLGTEYNPDEWAMSTPSQEWQDHCAELFQSNGFDCKIGG